MNVNWREQVKTVSDLILLLGDLSRGRPAGPPEVVATYLDLEAAVEQDFCRALAVYGAVLCSGMVYAPSVPVRTARFVRLSVTPAAALPWPPPPDSSAAERLAGHIAQTSF